MTRTTFTSIVKYLPPPNTWTYRPLERIRKPLALEVVSDFVSAALRAAGIDADLPSDSGRSSFQDGDRRTGSRKSWTIAPHAVTWTRAARRNRAKDALDVPRVPLFHACIRVEEADDPDRDRRSSVDLDGKRDDNVVVALDWLRGTDRKVVDGLWAFLIRKIGDAVRTA